MSDDDNTPPQPAFDVPIMILQCGVGPVYAMETTRELSGLSFGRFHKFTLFCSEECMRAGRHVR